MNFNFDRWLCDYSEARDKNLYGDELDSAKAAWEAAQPKWCPIETAPMGKAVLVFYKNSLGKDRIIKAQYIKKHTEEACEECVAIGFSDYCEEKDEYFTPEGWYEIIDNGHEYSSYLFDAIRNYFGYGLCEVLKDDNVLWKFCEVVSTIYGLKKAAELLRRGGSHYTSNPDSEFIKDEEYAKHINSVLIPQQIRTMYDILGHKVKSV